METISKSSDFLIVEQDMLQTQSCNEPRARIILIENHEDMSEYIRLIVAEFYEIEVVSNEKTALQ